MAPERRLPRPAALARSRAWREAPSVATTTVLRWTAASLYALGGVLLLLAAAHLGDQDVAVRGIVTIACVALAVGAVLAVLGQRLGRPAYHGVIALGTVLISCLVLLGHGGTASVALSIPYLFVIVDAVFLFALRQALVHVAVAEAACVACLLGVGVPVGVVILSLGCTLGLAVVSAWLARAASAADQDALTGLANRRGFDRRLEETLRRVERDGGRVALAVFDLDAFKQLNDAEGHAAGDRLLEDCGRAWRGEVPESATLARYGGDEFALLLPDTALGGAADLVDSLRSLTPAGVTVSAGVAAWSPGDSGSILMNRADVALYEAKTAGRDRTVAYGDPGRAASELESAIDRGELVLAYMPVVQLSTREVIGSEALVRWRHPQRGLVMPDDFIPEAERTGAIRSLGEWLVATVCRTVMSGPEPRRTVGLNASAHELRSPHYASMVIANLDRWSMSGDLLAVEVTEGAFDDDDPHVLENLRALRARGVLISIDDFGSGYSSLRRLDQLPIDIIKLDGALVSAIPPDSDHAPILQAIVSMGHSLDVRLVAERVETEHQAVVLQRLGYDLAQGYLFGRPEIHEE